jgi:sulfite reductase (NADPH) flavoprotein alpha-component
MLSNALDTQNSPLTADQASQVNRLVEALEPEQLSWVSGYFTGLRHAAGQAAGAQPAAEEARLTILYGSETGNAERVAREAAEAAAARGLAARVVDRADYKPRELRDERLILIVTATHGEGAPPDPAADFYEFLHGRKAPKLGQTQFAVLALGDSSYEFFCQTGRDFDARLEELGAHRLTDRLDCDVEFEAPAAQWLDKALQAYENAAGRPAQPRPAGNVIEFAGHVSRAAAPTLVYDRKRPFSAEALENLVLNGRGSERETRHIELSLAGSGIDYAPGDVLGLLPHNREETVAELLEALALDPQHRVAGTHEELPLTEVLRREYEITTLTPGFIRAWAEHSGDETLRALTGEDARAELARFMRERWLIDVITEHPAPGVDAATLLGMLRRLQPREYSIASSLAANPDEVHLTVAAVRYASRGRDRHGVASTHLADSIAPGDRVDVYVRPNNHFRLPADPNTPVIMVGPGTGVAPFRAFMQEREIMGAKGANWLFFGNPHLRTDFLYQTEWQKWLADGVLQRLDVAFSRDQDHKVYVQHRIREAGAELYGQLEQGAHFYVCGDAERMAGDVHAALVEIVRAHGGRSEEAAVEYVKQMQRDKRYQRDVY